MSRKKFRIAAFYFVIPLKPTMAGTPISLATTAEWDTTLSL